MIDALLLAVERLNATLAEENAALSALDLPRAAAMLAAKRSVAEGFLAAGSALERAGIGRVTGTTRRSAEAAFSRLATLAETNRSLLQRAIDVQTRVLGTVARAVPRAALQAATGYGAHGRMAHGSGRPPAIAVCARA